MTEIERIIKKGKLELRANGIQMMTKLDASEVQYIKDNLAEIKAALATTTKGAAMIEQAARKDTKMNEKKAELNAIKLGQQKIIVDSSGFYGLPEVFGQAADLLVDLGLAKWLQNGSCRVDTKMVKAIGEEFTYQEAVEYMRPAKEAQAEKVAKDEAETQAKFDEAKAIGRPVVIKTGSAPCNDPSEECNMDIVTVYAMPDGTTKTERQHCW
jgi:hypothetical protein